MELTRTEGGNYQIEDDFGATIYIQREELEQLIAYGKAELQDEEE